MSTNELVSTAELKKIVSVGKNTLIRLREQCQLLEGVHFFKVPGGKKFLWNLELVKDFFVTGGGVRHQTAIDSYLHSLPSNQPQKVGRKRA